MLLFERTNFKILSRKVEWSLQTASATLKTEREFVTMILCCWSNTLKQQRYKENGLTSLRGEASKRLSVSTTNDIIAQFSEYALRAFVHSCIRAFVHSCIRAFVHSCIRAFVHSCIRACLSSCVCCSDKRKKPMRQILGRYLAFHFDIRQYQTLCLYRTLAQSYSSRSYLLHNPATS